MTAPNTHAPSSSAHLALSRLCEALRSASEALLLQSDFRPTPTGDLWLDPLSARTLPFAQALSTARSEAMKDRSLVRFARSIDELELTIVTVAGLSIWHQPDANGRVPRTRSEAVEVIRRQIEGKG